MHSTFHQLDRTHNNCIHKTCKAPIFNPVPERKFLLLFQNFVKLIGAEYNSIDQRDSHKGIVDPIEEGYEALLLNDASHQRNHGGGGVDLHFNFKGVKNVAGETIGHPGYAATEEIHYSIFKFL